MCRRATTETTAGSSAAPPGPSGPLVGGLHGRASEQGAINGLQEIGKVEDCVVVCVECGTIVERSSVEQDVHAERDFINSRRTVAIAIPVAPRRRPRFGYCRLPSFNCNGGEQGERYRYCPPLHWQHRTPGADGSATMLPGCSVIRSAARRARRKRIVTVFEKLCPAIPNASGDVITVAQQLTDV